MTGTDVIPRFVGSYEYWNSLKTLERLVSESEPDQIRVYDELIAVRPEFSIQIGTANAFWGPKAGFDASGVVIDPNDVQTGTRRTGLAWLMALARIELSASLSAYTEVKDPFMQLVPTELDRREYEVVLFDDALTHLLALQDDPKYDEVTVKSRDADLNSLDFWRRIKLVKDMIQAASKSSINDERTVASWKTAYEDLEKEQGELYSSIAVTLAELSVDSQRYAEGTIVDTPHCARLMLLAAEQRGDVASRRIAPK